MKSFTLKFLSLLTFAFVFAVQANAQLCGSYTTSLQITTADDKPVETAVVQLLPIEKDETEGKTFVRDETNLSKFSITFLEGHQLKANYKLIISADGFETLEREIKFPHCKKRSLDIQLKILKTDNLSTLSGKVFDISKALVPETKISLKEQSGKVLNTKSNESGEYEIELPKGIYTIEFIQSGFKTLKVVSLEIPSNINKKLDVILEVGRCEDCNGALYGERWDDFAVLSGFVYDSNGAIISNAIINLTDSTNKIKSAVTNRNGFLKL